LIGIEFAEKCAPVHSRLLDEKIVTGTSADPHVLRLLPPLCVTTGEIDMFVDRLQENSVVSGSAHALSQNK
jgi:acetylornithine/succinyldiaminopimelate/putrescine aminotransferase